MIMSYVSACSALLFCLLLLSLPAKITSKPRSQHVRTRQLLTPTTTNNNNNNNNDNNNKNNNIVTNISSEVFAGLDPHRAVVLPPPYSFLQQAISDHSLRIVIIGGINSIPSTSTNNNNDITYMTLLQTWLDTNVFFSKKRSYVRSAAMPSTADTTRLDVKSRLTQLDIRTDILALSTTKERATPTTWPNVLLLEHGQDCWDSAPLQCVFVLETVLQRVFALYDSHGLPPPDVVFVDIVRLDKYYWFGNNANNNNNQVGNNINTRQFPANLSPCNASTRRSEASRSMDSRAHAAFAISQAMEFNDRGSYFGMALVEFARFYRHVVLSTSDAWYPAFVQHFLTHSLCEPWPFLHEGQRLTALGHEALFHIIQHVFDIVLLRTPKTTATASPQQQQQQPQQQQQSSSSSVYCTDVKFGLSPQYSDTPLWRNFSIPTKNISESYYLPTSEELNRAFFTIPKESWGAQFATQRSLRMLALGGSNTANGGNYIDDLKTLFANATSFPFPQRYLNASASYVLNGGISGWGPTVLKMPFERDWPPSQWPNVLLMEFSVNCGGGWSCVEAMEKVLSYYQRLYAAHGLPLPDVFFLELFRAEEDHGVDPDCDEAVLWTTQHNPALTQRITSDTLYTLSRDFHDRGVPLSMYLAEYARFHQWPILSMVDAWYPSFLRYRDSHLDCAHWPFTGDNVHIHGEGQREAVATIVSFLQRRLQRWTKNQNKANPNPNPYNNASETSPQTRELVSRMFYDGIYQGGDVVSQYRMWGANIPEREFFKFAVISQQGFAPTHLRHHDDNQHNCLGATTADAIVVFKAEVHPVYVYKLPLADRTQVRFTVVLGVLHSWDKGYIGSLRCDLFPSRPDRHARSSNESVASVLIHGYEFDHMPVRDSTPRNVVITKTLDIQPYLLECTNLVSDRLSCITHLTIYTNQ